MRVFISWSGDTANKVAKALNEWLPLVIQEVEVFTSSLDIPKGGRWANAVSDELDKDSEGIVVVTAENQHSPWLNFEAGALAKSVKESSVRPVLLDLTSADVTGPLAQFQHTDLNSREDVLALVQSINIRCSSPLPSERLMHTFDREWEDLRIKLTAIREESAPTTGPSQVRSSDDILEEILVRVRRIEREEIGRDEHVNPTDDLRSIARVLEQTGRFEEALHLYRTIAEENTASRINNSQEYPRRMRPSDASAYGLAAVRFKDGRLGTLRLPQPMAEQLRVRLDDGGVVYGKWSELVLLSWTPRERPEEGELN
ncbi:toll/interleukin-1 receptor domain-containing protein [Streptomyces gardneri]|nr:toll/interleukin-1 receptor domain-containing protein [Streptomyces gardneri]